jgi:MYXO-CTERM domain-containing protein
MRQCCFSFAIAALAATSAAQFTPIEVNLNSNVDLRAGVWASRFVEGTGGVESGSQLIYGFPDYPTGPISFLVDLSVGQLADPYTFLAQYGEDGVAIALDPVVAEDAINNATSWDELFAGPEEDTIYDALSGLQAFDFSQLAVVFNFFNSNIELFPQFGVTATMVKFSDASFGGTIEAAPVPEPATALLALGLLGFLRRRR